MHYLVVTDTVHTTAAACDYLEERLGADDTVSVLAPGDDDTRDAGDALNVANARLLGEATLETRRLDAEMALADAVLEVVDDEDVAAVVVGDIDSESGEEGPLGDVTKRIAARSTVPVVVVPDGREA